MATLVDTGANLFVDMGLVEEDTGIDLLDMGDIEVSDVPKSACEPTPPPPGKTTLEEAVSSREWRRYVSSFYTGGRIHIPAVRSRDIRQGGRRNIRHIPAGPV